MHPEDFYKLVILHKKDYVFNYTDYFKDKSEQWIYDNFTIRDLDNCIDNGWLAASNEYAISAFSYIATILAKYEPLLVENNIVFFFLNVFTKDAHITLSSNVIDKFINDSDIKNHLYYLFTRNGRPNLVIDILPEQIIPVFDIIINYIVNTYVHIPVTNYYFATAIQNLFGRKLSMNEVDSIDIRDDLMKILMHHDMIDTPEISDKVYLKMKYG